MSYVVLASIIVLVLIGYVVLRRGNSKQLASRKNDVGAQRVAASSEPRSSTLQKKLQERRTEMANPLVGSGSSVDMPDELNDDLLEERGSAKANRLSRPPPPHLSSRPPPKSVQSLYPLSTGDGSNVSSLRQGLARSRGEAGFFGKLATLLRSRPTIDPVLIEELESLLLSSDVGVKGTEKILTRLREEALQQKFTDTASIWKALRTAAVAILNQVDPAVQTPLAHPTVILLVGVNGAGKTTTVGKLATKLKAEGRRVVLAAGDTFRAAAVQQLEVWAKRVDCEVVVGKEGADAASVAFEAVRKAQEMNADVVLIDTAGRLQTKIPLMDELRKMAKTLNKAMEGAPHETWLVVDATTGQNALSQARQFGDTLPLSGIVLTKLDGTAKGGIVLSICEEMSIPVRYVGLGERSEDLHAFVAEEFVEALLGDAGRSQDAA